MLHQSVHKIAQVCHSKTESIIIASDRSTVDKENIMTFGWQIVTNEEDTLAEHLGPAFGQATFFCAEGFANIIKDQMKYIHDCLFSTLELDWDIVAQSAHTLKSYGTNLTITHVKSHQDDKALMDELDLPTRLNVAGDCLATWYRL
eukprot:8257542-Ditylum_brightwellii.AAC.1